MFLKSIGLVLVLSIPVPSTNSLPSVPEIPGLSYLLERDNQDLYQQTLPPLNQENLLPDVNDEVYIMPATGIFTSGYGWRWGRMHNGIDIAGPIGTPIIASKSGTIITSEWNTGGYGNLIEIEHADGSITLYAHNNRLLVQKGQIVKQGELIAEMGSTGFSTGPHLHFEIHEQDRVLNPLSQVAVGTYVQAKEELRL